jgi:hypothetical protein
VVGREHTAGAETAIGAIALDDAMAPAYSHQRSAAQWVPSGRVVQIGESAILAHGDALDVEVILCGDIAAENKLFSHTDYLILLALLSSGTKFCSYCCPAIYLTCSTPKRSFTNSVDTCSSVDPR